jgi:hypothetical protein
MQGAEGRQRLVAEPMQRPIRDRADRLMATHHWHEAATAAQHADRDARCVGTPATGPLANEPLMIHADTSLRVGP